MENKSNRDYAISYVRFVAMIMIIVCHFFQYYKIELAFWFNVGVEIFFVISGFLYASREIDDPIFFIGTQLKKILIPYYMFLFPVSLLYVLFSRTNFSIESFVKAIFCVGTIEGLGHLWFIGYILFCYFLTPYLYWLSKKISSASLIKNVGIYMILFAGVTIIGTLTDSYFKPYRILAYIVGYVIATLGNKYGNRVMNAIKYSVICLAIVLNAIRVCMKYFMTFPKGTLPYKLFVFVEPYIHLLLGIGLFFVLYSLFSRANSCAVVYLSDRYSFPIYLVHQTFILSPFNTMNITSIKLINWLVTISLILVFGALLRFSTELGGKITAGERVVK